MKQTKISVNQLTFKEYNNTKKFEKENSDKKFDGLLAYLGGFLDGEGHLLLNFRKRNNKYSFEPVVTMGQYLGGLMDAEGCIIFGMGKIQQSSINITPRCTIVQKESGISISLFQVLVEIFRKQGLKASVVKECGRDILVLKITGCSSVKKFLRLLLPYLILKRKQAKIMLAIIKRKEKYGHRWNRPAFIKTMVMMDKMNSLKGGCRGKYNANYFRKLWGFKRKRQVDTRNRQKRKVYI